MSKGLVNIANLRYQGSVFLKIIFEALFFSVMYNKYQFGL